jgi:NitT/TauT family transport system substrate-binding protein
MNALINGDADIAAVATNVAANLVNKTDGGIQVLAINTPGVLYILEKGDTVQTMSDLRGKTLYAPSTAKGANPEYILNYLLEENDVEPDQVNIEWMTPQEITAKMASSDAGVCMLPVPAATALLLKDSGVREAISLSDEWDKLENGALAQGCIVARTEYVQAHPEQVTNFLSAYEQSIAYMNDEANRADAAELVARYGITANAAIAARAIPQCNLTYIAGSEMKDILEPFYQIMYQADPKSIGGAMPYDSFYYGAE